jgi:transcriptional regulator with XRE-family HTH domain
VLAELRRLHGLDQAELARRVGAHRPALSHLENGRAVAQVELIFRVLRELGYEVRLEPTGAP